MNVIYYEGERIYFRPVEVEDEPLLRRWINDPRVWSTLTTRPPVNATREREWIEQQGKSQVSYNFGIVLRDADRLIGACDLSAIHPITRSATVGICIGDVDSHNKGYGSESLRLLLRFGFEELNLNRIDLSVIDFNEQAIHVYEKAGFSLEGRHRQAYYRHGQYRDVLRYAVLRTDWDKLNENTGDKDTPGKAAETPIEVTI